LIDAVFQYVKVFNDVIEPGLEHLGAFGACRMCRVEVLALIDGLDHVSLKITNIRIEVHRPPVKRLRPIKAKVNANHLIEAIYIIKFNLIIIYILRISYFILVSLSDHVDPPESLNVSLGLDELLEVAYEIERDVRVAEA